MKQCSSLNQTIILLEKSQAIVFIDSKVGLLGLSQKIHCLDLIKLIESARHVFSVHKIFCLEEMFRVIHLLCVEFF